MKKTFFVFTTIWAMAVSFYSCTKDIVSIDDVGLASGSSPYITKVFDYQYGPGQHAALLLPNEKAYGFIGEPWVNGKTCTLLGGWGGYLVAGFDHAVINANGPDIAIYTQPSVSSEPGIVFVMTDSNNDGLPNDGPWIELMGSEYHNPETIHNYQVTYYKPGLSGYVTWKDNKGKQGSLVSGFENSSWWWAGYGDKTSVSFEGEKLPDAYYNSETSSEEELWVLRSGLFQFGYAECYSNSDFNAKQKANFLDLSSAVDSAGQPVSLTKINFIKIQSSVFQRAGWLNEISTEVSGAADIHLLDKTSY